MGTLGVLLLVMSLLILSFGDDLPRAVRSAVNVLAWVVAAGTCVLYVMAVRAWSGRRK